MANQVVPHAKVHTAMATMSLQRAAVDSDGFATTLSALMRTPRSGIANAAALRHGDFTARCKGAVRKCGERIGRGALGAVDALTRPGAGPTFRTQASGRLLGAGPAPESPPLRQPRRLAICAYKSPDGRWMSAKR